jgi:hypothetical protein
LGGESVVKRSKNIMIIGLIVLFVFSIIGYTTIRISANKAFEQTIDTKLYSIMHPKSGGSSSSNPYEYLAKGRDDYDYILSQGEKSLNYMLEKFSESSADGLEEYIMALACSKILKEDPLYRKWYTGREWYENYIKANK